METTVGDRLMRALIAALFLGFLPAGDDAGRLIKKLSTGDFESQGKAADALARMGAKALPALKEAAKGDDADRRFWAERILRRIRERDEKLRALIKKLGSADDEEKEEAEEGLFGMGDATIPYLLKATKSGSKNLRRQAGKLLKRMDPRGSRVRRILGQWKYAPGRYRFRLGGKQNLVARGGGGADTEDAVLAALKWLSRHQSAGGSWKTRNHEEECQKIAKYDTGKNCEPNPGYDDFDAGNTGLALLAFLGAGYTHLSRDTYDGICFGEVVRKGAQWMMMGHQDPEGCIGSRKEQKYMYNHAICAAALAEAYGITGSNLFKEQAQKAVDFLVAAQNRGKAWRYSYRSGDNDTSVTGWAAMALKSAEMAGLNFPRSSHDGVKKWLGEVTEKEGAGRTGYTHKGTGKVFVPGLNAQFDHHEALSAIAMVARIMIDRDKRDPLHSKAGDLLLRDKPSWKGNAIDFYYWYWGSMALYQFDGPSGPKWKAWNEDIKNALVLHQNALRAGCKAGSWEPVGRWCGEGGRVYATAINCLTLQVYYRYPLAFDKK